MKSRLSLSVAVYALVFVAILPGIVCAKTGTLVLNDGRRFENVSYSVDKFYQVVKFKQEGDKEKSAVSFVDIRAIIDKNGENIAPKLLGRWYRPSYDDAETPVAEDTAGAAIESPDVEKTSPPPRPSATTSDWQSENDEPFREARRKPWSFAIRAGGNVSLPIGTWFEDVNPTVGFDGDCMVFLTHQFGLHFRFSRAGLTVDDDFYFTGYMDPGLTIYNMNSQLSVNRYCLYFFYYDRLRGKRDGKTTFYAGVGVGAVEHNGSGSAWVTDGVDVAMITVDGGETKFATTTEIGAIFLLTDNLGLDAGLSLDIIYIGTAYDYSGYKHTQTAGIFDFKVGFIWLL